MKGWLSLLGMARKAGKVEIGEESVHQSVSDHRARLILIASDAGATTAERALRLGSEKLPAVSVPCDREELGSVLGFAAVSALAVTDLGFAAALAEKLAQEQPELASVSQVLAQRQEKARRRKADTARLGRKSKRKS